MVNSRLSADDTTLEALSVAMEHARLIASADSDRTVYDDRNDTLSHEHNRPSSLETKRRKTTLGEVDQVRSQALTNTVHHALDQLLKQPTQHLDDVQRLFTADESFAYLVFPSEAYGEPWGFLLPWREVRESLPEPSRYRPINHVPGAKRNEPERNQMTLETALGHLKTLNVDVNNYFPDSVTYTGDVEPEFRFDYSSVE